MAQALTSGAACVNVVSMSHETENSPFPIDMSDPIVGWCVEQIQHADPDAMNLPHGRIAALFIRAILGETDDARARTINAITAGGLFETFRRNLRAILTNPTVLDDSEDLIEYLQDQEDADSL
jgi:hypothetical protein